MLLRFIILVLLSLLCCPAETANIAQSLCHFTAKDDKLFMVINEKMIDMDHHVIGDLLGDLVCTRDGKHYAYPTYVLKKNTHILPGGRTETEGGWIVLDGKQGLKFDDSNDIKDIKFTPDGKILRIYMKKNNKWRWEVMEVE